MMPIKEKESHTAGHQLLAIANCLETADIQSQLFHVNQKTNDMMFIMVPARAMH